MATFSPSHFKSVVTAKDRRSDRQTSPDQLDPTVEGLKNTIESSAEFTIFFDQIFTETLIKKNKQKINKNTGDP